MFQIADIHALATTGEGFGIPTIESQSCGLPNVITDYTTSKELVGEPETGLIIPIAYELTGTWTVERGFIDKDKMCEALETLYGDENLRKEMSKKARENALKYDWNKIVFPMWDKKIKEVLEE
jgi:glycosyltransferase involved in cell wall biosynthesis